MKTVKNLVSFVLILTMLTCVFLPISGGEYVYKQYCIALSAGSDETERGFSWYFADSGTGVFTYTEASKLVDGAMPEDAISIEAEGVLANENEEYSYQVELCDLKPSTEYAYQLTNRDVVSDVIRFTTGEDGDFSFVLLGDIQVDHQDKTHYDLWENTLQILDTSEVFEGSSFLLSAGDQVDYGIDELDYGVLLDHDILNGVTFVPTIGNHDRNSTAFQSHFNLPNESDKYGLNLSGSDYYFTYNDVLFMSLNTNCESAEEHRAFMEETIAAHPEAKWKIVVMHHAVFGATSHIYEDNNTYFRQNLVPVIDELDIDMVFTGHDHVYVRTYLMDGTEPITDPAAYDNEEMTSVTDPEHPVYITANSASGTKTYDPFDYDEIPYARVARQDHVPYASRVFVSDVELTITTYRLDSLEQVDSFTINKTPTLPFTDFEEGKWYTEGIRYCYINEYMAGVSESEFGRKQNVTRAMFATILAKLDGADLSSYTEMSFSDVPEGNWYSGAIEWAAQNGYAAGLGGGIFGRKNDVTREQLAMFLYTYSEKNGVDVSARADLTGYDDYDKIHGYALEAMGWAVKAELISGTSDITLAPRASASRAEIALIIKNYVENVK